MDPEQKITIGPPTPEHAEELQKGLDSWNKHRDQEMRLHLTPISKLLKMSVNDRRQAFIEWQLQYAAISIIYNAEGELEPQWQFLNEHSVEARAQKVQKYEEFIDSLRSHPGFEIDEVKNLVQERRRALYEAVSTKSERTLNDILNLPGFERYQNRKSDESTKDINQRKFKLIGAAQSYPLALLYNLFNNPPAFLQRTSGSNSNEEGRQKFSLLKENERTFMNWLQASAKNNKDGWLTVEEVNKRNQHLSPQTRVFNPKNSDWVDTDTVKALIFRIRKYPEYQDAIETRPRTGKAWRLKNWQTIGSE